MPMTQQQFCVSNHVRELVDAHEIRLEAFLIALVVFVDELLVASEDLRTAGAFFGT